MESCTNLYVSHCGTVPRIAHGSAACAILGLDDLIATELNPVDELVNGLLIAEKLVVDLGLRLREQRNDGCTAVSADDRDGVLGRLLRDVQDFSYESRSANDVESRDTEEPADGYKAHLSGNVGALTSSG